MTNDLAVRLRKRAMELSYDDADLSTARLVTEAVDEIDRLTGEVKRLTLQLGGYAAGATDDMNQIVQMGMAHEEFQAKADALAKDVETERTILAARNDSNSQHVAVALRAALTAYRNKEIIQGEVGKEIVENEE